jgi:PAS domain-containing protein
VIYSIEISRQMALHVPTGSRALHDLVTSEPAFVVGSDTRVRAWNEPLEQLTGVPADAVLGHPCHLVIGAISDGAVPSCCRTGCPLLEGGRRGSPPGRAAFLLATREGPRAASFVTIAGTADEVMHLVELDRPGYPGPMPTIRRSSA